MTITLRGDWTNAAEEVRAGAWGGGMGGESRREEMGWGGRGRREGVKGDGRERGSQRVMGGREAVSNKRVIE